MGYRNAAKLIFALSLVCSFFINIGSLKAADLHLIAVADYECNLYKALWIDINKMRAEARFICQHTGMNLHETVLAGSTARASILLESIHNLDVAEDDLIIFYYSGHGFRTFSSGDSLWPNLFFSKERNAVDLAVVLELINQKNVRLQIIIADCCNSYLPDGRFPLVSAKQIDDVDKSIIADNYKKLFLDSRGSVIISSSKPGLKSLTTTVGSLFTIAFLKVLHEKVKNPSDSMDWQNVLDGVKERIETWVKEKSISIEQEPLYLIMPIQHEN
jgi:hypothetical protein